MRVSGGFKGIVSLSLARVPACCKLVFYLVITALVSVVCLVELLVITTYALTALL